MKPASSLAKRRSCRPLVTAVVVCDASSSVGAKRTNRRARSRMRSRESSRTRFARTALTIVARGFTQSSKRPLANLFDFNRFLYGNLGCLPATFNRAFGRNSLIREWFLYGNQKLPYSTRDGVTCHPSFRCAAPPRTYGCWQLQADQPVDVG